MKLTSTIHSIQWRCVARQTLTYKTTRSVQTSCVHTDTKEVTTFINIYKWWDVKMVKLINIQKTALRNKNWSITGLCTSGTDTIEAILYKLKWQIDKEEDLNLTVCWTEYHNVHVFLRTGWFILWISLIMHMSNFCWNLDSLHTHKICLVLCGIWTHSVEEFVITSQTITTWPWWF